MITIAIICALLSIIPAGIVFLNLHTRGNDFLNQINMIKHDADLLKKIQADLNEMLINCDRLEAQYENVKESFQQLSNKIASRARTEVKQEKKEREPGPDAYEQLELPMAPAHVPNNGGAKPQFVKKIY